MTWTNLEKTIKNVAPGGRYMPGGCTSQWKVAIIVPYRDRENHLKMFVKNMHPFLQQQQIYYGIFVIEMPPGLAFNRGLLMNVGFKESSRIHNYNCFIFHDVDLLPEHIGNIYKCGDFPKHMASAIDTRNYKVYYKHSFGGVNAFTREQFIRVNGFSTVYFGWGREDDDLYQRCLHANLTMQRLPVRIGRYKNLTHPRATLAERNSELYKTREDRYVSDGISNLTYKRIKLEIRPLYTWILIGI
ncbi:beta-1,4-N-acetylgalactosaminyltransferase bre-4-like [Ruditapes philippinarum]|uniref:beta-1,4-N-acetylgalactosaminyltransferase bre-4-like n=1 Tax=Ruditapes philippinarum TaxID=129788 RepID=UPI00295C1676|nr:beta-1,4-N-acetylgalactosaminyltransferase bre-4-like [Ruditapes philippinarum]